MMGVQIMGFRFRKSINLGGGFRINLSKSGIGYSYGGKGFRVTKRADGKTQTTMSIPGTGISYTETSSAKKKANSASAKKPAVASDAGSLDNLANALTILAIVIAAAGLYIVLKVSWWGYALVAAALALLFWMLSW